MTALPKAKHLSHLWTSNAPSEGDQNVLKKPKLDMALSKLAKCSRGEVLIGYHDQTAIG
jgi:hypothetical protein